MLWRAVSAVGLLVAAPFACSDDPAASDAAGIDARIIADAAPTPDSCLLPDHCNPFWQTGCNSEDRCTYTHPVAGGWRYFPGCFPDGHILEDEPCTVEPGELDDCVAGTLCFAGSCRRFCYPAPGSECLTGGCGLLMERVHCVTGELYVCHPPCNALDPTCPDGYSCYFHTSWLEESPACLPTGAGELDSPCTFSQECAPGLVCASDQAGPFETNHDTGACRPICDVEADDCGPGELCADYTPDDVYGACVGDS